MSRFVAAFFAGLLAWTGAVAQDYPSKVITLIAPYAAGGSIDLVARLIGGRLADKLGQPVIVRNVPGAGGTVGTREVAKAAPDGYTLILASIGPNAVGASLYANLGYDAAKDFAPITLLARQPLIFTVPSSSPVKTIQELVALGKQSNAPTFGSAGIGSAAHLTGEYFKSQTSTSFVHVPYKGTAPLSVAVLGGEVSMGVLSAIDVVPHVKSGKMRALAVSSPERSATLPDVPTVAETVAPGFGIEVWYGLMAPAGTPRPIVERLHNETVAILAEPAIRERILGLAATPAPSTPEAFGAFVKDEIAKYARIIKTAGIKAE
jgi:tripartite-type tricarboxylate transporter receptor subunit TctC